MNTLEERQDEEHLKLSRQFRESALKLSSSCDSSIGWAVTQNLLVGFRDDQEVASGQPVLYACRTCGFIVHPGFLGTTLRIVRNKKSEITRTRLRREQRRKRKAAIEKQKQKRDPNLPKNIDSIRKEGTNLVILEDDESVVCDRHYVKVTCGQCRSSVRCKGLKREVANLKSLSATEQSNNFAQKKEKAPQLKSTPNFVALPPAAHAVNAREMQKEPRKKKKKKKAQPTSNLMSFLNSLND